MPDHRAGVCRVEEDCSWQASGWRWHGAGWRMNDVLLHGHNSRCPSAGSQYKNAIHGLSQRASTVASRLAGLESMTLDAISVEVSLA